jgi:hypothetical protein
MAAAAVFAMLVQTTGTAWACKHRGRGGCGGGYYAAAPSCGAPYAAPQYTYQTSYQQVTRTVYETVPVTTEQEITETVSVPVTRQEQRQATVYVQQMRPVEQQRTVLVPQTRQVQQQRTVCVPTTRQVQQ